jgi:hypothetical protein
MTYYTTAHRDDAASLIGDKLDACTNHMVFDSGYDLEIMRDITLRHPWKVAIEMEKDSTAKYGYRFARFVGVPNHQQPR